MPPLPPNSHPTAPKNWLPQVVAPRFLLPPDPYRGPSGQELPVVPALVAGPVAHQAALSQERPSFPPGWSVRLRGQAHGSSLLVARELEDGGGLAAGRGPAVGEDVVAVLPGLLPWHMRVGESERGGQVRWSWPGTAEVLSPAFVPSPPRVSPGV